MYLEMIKDRRVESSGGEQRETLASSLVLVIFLNEIKPFSCSKISELLSFRKSSCSSGEEDWELGFRVSDSMISAEEDEEPDVEKHAGRVASGNGVCGLLAVTITDSSEDDEVEQNKLLLTRGPISVAACENKTGGFSATAFRSSVSETRKSGPEEIVEGLCS